MVNGGGAIDSDLGACAAERRTHGGWGEVVKRRGVDGKRRR
jgi:hypothetical protein